MNDNLKYEEIHPRSRKELEAAFVSEDENAICNAMFSAAQHEPDWRWTQARLLGFLNHKSLKLRSVALMALGELALFRGHIDVEIVLPEVYRLKGEPALEPFLEQCIQDIKEVVTVH